MRGLRYRLFDEIDQSEKDKRSFEIKKLKFFEKFIQMPLLSFEFKRESSQTLQ